MILKTGLGWVMWLPEEEDEERALGSQEQCQGLLQAAEEFDRLFLHDGQDTSQIIDEELLSHLTVYTCSQLPDAHFYITILRTPSSRHEP